MSLRASLRSSAAALLILLLGVVIGMLGARVLDHEQRVAKLPSAGRVDVGFAQAMSAHHDQAMTMCRIVSPTASGAVGQIAHAIETTQLLELGQMQGWLNVWGQPQLPQARIMDWMLPRTGALEPRWSAYLGACSASPAGMQGMASDAELDRLRALVGSERDRLFLQLMIRHHQGALPMAEFAAAHAETPAVRSFAARVVYEQGLEIVRLRQVLASSPGLAAERQP